MSHELKPKDGAPFLAPVEAISRLRSEFDYVTVDSDAGADHVGEMLATFLRLKAPETTVQFYSSRQKQSFMVEIADAADTDLSVYFALVPDVALLIGYSSAQDEAVCLPLVERCARALGYQVVLV